MAGKLTKWKKKAEHYKLKIGAWLRRKNKVEVKLKKWKLKLEHAKEKIEKYEQLKEKHKKAIGKLED